MVFGSRSRNPPFEVAFDLNGKFASIDLELP